MAIHSLLTSTPTDLIQNNPYLLITLPVLSLIIYIFTNELYRHSLRIPTLPGPRGLPLIGNLHQIRTNAAEQYRLWAKTHGDVYQVQLGNVPVVVVNSARAARALFGNLSGGLKSRPEFYTFHKVLSDTAGTTIGTSPYSPSLQRRRKGAASALNKPSIQTYLPHLDLETRAFVAECTSYGNRGTTPLDPMAMIQRLSLSLALTLNWGVRMASQEEAMFAEITEVEEEISRFRSTTGNLQDYIPLLRINPFNPGSRRAREMRDRRDKYLTELNRGLEERMRAGTQKACIQANVMMDKEASLNEAELTSISLTMLSGGLDTVTTLLQWSIALLAQRPDIQEKAIRNIRALHGDALLCDVEDDQGCKYVVALVRECLRYFTVLRLALPRTSVKDMTYNSVHFPAGTVFFLNAWSCNMDPAVWSNNASEPDPHVFAPERWLSQPEAPLFTYGLGYRMCAGSLLANRELYIVFVRLISCFRIEEVDAVDTRPVEGSSDPTSLVSMPKRYRVKMVPRNEEGLSKVLDKNLSS